MEHFAYKLLSSLILSLWAACGWSYTGGELKNKYNISINDKEKKVYLPAGAAASVNTCGRGRLRVMNINTGEFSHLDVTIDGEHYLIAVNGDLYTIVRPTQPTLMTAEIPHERTHFLSQVSSLQQANQYLNTINIETQHKLGEFEKSFRELEKNYQSQKKTLNLFKRI